MTLGSGIRRPLAGLLATVFFVGCRGGDQPPGRAPGAAAIRSVLDTNRDRGWIQTFEATRTQPLPTYDPSWHTLFGQLIVDARLGALIGDPEGGWQRDRGDDYAFRITPAVSGDVEIVVDGWWDGMGSIGAQGCVQQRPPHRLYEAALWRGKLMLIYFHGPRPEDFTVLAEAAPTEARLTQGAYRIVFRLVRDGAGWTLRATLQDPSRHYAELVTASAHDSRLSAGGQGVGILGTGGPRASHITGIAVRALIPAR